MLFDVVSPRPAQQPVAAEFDGQVDAVMDAARVMNSIVTRSARALEPTVTASQLRVLVMLSAHGPLNLSSVAAGLGVHPSNATRACTRLADLGLLSRRGGHSDRRNVELVLTGQGQRTVDTVMRNRRVEVGQILTHLSAARRQRLATALYELIDAAVDTSDEYALVLEGYPPSP